MTVGVPPYPRGVPVVGFLVRHGGRAAGPTPGHSH